MTEFRNGELFAYVRGDSRRRDMVGIAAEMRESARMWSNGYGEILYEWADRLERAAEELHMELGQVKSKARDDAYFCWYSTGDTAACTPVANMHKLENAGWSHVERGGDDDWCEWKLVHGGCIYDKWQCSKCGYEYVESRTDAGTTDFDPRFCPECGRHIR